MLSPTSVRPLCWKIRGKPVFLLGSIHLGPPGGFDLGSAVMSAFDESTQVYFEISPGEYPKVPALIERRNATLEQDIGKELYGRFRSDPRYKDSHESVIAAFALVQMAGVVYSEIGMSADHGVDLMLLRRAVENSVQPKGLETAAEQLEGFTSTEPDVLRSAFAMVLDHPERLVQARDLIIEGVIRGDMKLIDAARAKSYQTFPQVAEKMFDQRELRWGPKIVAIANSGMPTMIVVGASHLAGASPIWAYLKQHGYDVDRFPSVSP